MTRLKATILGCGSSGGVPRIGNDWGAADPANPKNRRRRCSLLVQKFGADGASTDVLVDTSPDLREQLLAAGLSRADAVLYSHDHADQSHGIDDLRVLAQKMGARVNIHADPKTLETLIHRFDYCFATPPGSGYPPILEAHDDVAPGQPLTIEGPGGPLTALPIWQDHGGVHSYGFRFGSVAYSNDVVDLPPESFAALEDLDIWIVDALRYRPHSTHAHVAKALDWIARLQPKRAVLTNLHTDIDYATLRRELPDHVEPAYDGLTLETAFGVCPQQI